MQRTTVRMRLCMILLAINLLFIWGNSLLPGSVSGALSSWLKDLLAKLFGLSPSLPDSGEGLLRKMMHFTEFACLGALLTWLVSMLGKKVSIVPVYGALVAGADELIQRFVPDRNPALSDVLIDTAGVLTGMGLLCIAFFATKKKQQ